MSLALKPIYWGNEVEELYAYFRNFPDAFRITAAILALSYRIHLGDDGERFITRCFDGLSTCDPDGPAALAEYFASCRSRFAATGLREKLGIYKTESLLRTIKLVGKEHLSGEAVDIGADDNRLGRVILQACPDVRKVIGIDIENRGADVEAGRLEFIPISDFDTLPLQDKSVDTIILRFSLHHMSAETQERMIAEISRVLRGDGKLIMIEDSYSDAQPPVVRNAITTEFLQLDAASRQLVLALLDASSCFIYEERMPFTLSYRTIESWDRLLRNAELEELRSDFWGIPFFSLFQAPLAVLIYRKKEAA